MIALVRARVALLKHSDRALMTPATPDLPAVEQKIIELTNSARSEQKLGEVHANAQLTTAARAYAQYLASNNQFSHEADGRKASDRIGAAGYDWCTVGENLASLLDSAGFQTPDLARKSVEGWLNSPGHRQNMLAPFVTEIGVGVVKAPDKNPKYIAVQLFARPKSLAYAFQISNTTKETVTYTFNGETQAVEGHQGMQHEACVPSPLVFDKIGLGRDARSVEARFEASDGLVYVLKPDKAKGLAVEIEPMRKLPPAPGDAALSGR